MKIRLLCKQKIALDSEILLTADEYNYLVNVLKAKSNEEVWIFNGQEGEYLTNLIYKGKKQVALKVLEKVAPAESLPLVNLLFPILKKDATDYLVQKATELGVGTFTLVITERTIARSLNLKRLEAIATEAAEQSRRINVPVFNPPCKLKDLLLSGSIGNETTLFFLDETGKGSPIIPTLQSYKKKSGKIAFLIGPEGGFTPDEITFLYTLPFAKGISLDNHILKAETACLVPLAIWKYL